VYRVERIEQTAPALLPPAQPGCNHLAVVRACTSRLTGCCDLATLLDQLLAALREQLHVNHAMVLMLDPASRRLFTVASLGYEQSGVGAEIKLGEGVIGVAAQERAPIRISHATTEFGYGRAVRESAATHGMSGVMEHEIPFPGLPESRSQLAVPILASGELLGVLFVESTEDGRFGYDDEDALAIIANHLGTAMRLLDTGSETTEDARPATPRVRAPSGPAIRIRRFLENDSIFIDEDYLIKGVAGAILWKLARVYVEEQRTEHSNRELRLDPSIRLPDLSENLEARLILLQRRLEERCPHLRIEKTGRGRFRFHAARPLQLAEVSAR
jgi:putative methionine-R-sulfoxide reductase with GAF domain